MSHFYNKGHALTCNCIVLVFQSAKSRNQWLALVPNHFHQDAFSPAAVKLAVENLFPWTKVQACARNRHHHFPTHHLSLDVGISVVLTSEIVPVVTERFVRG